jgi:IS605 OrfB family transposase
MAKPAFQPNGKIGEKAKKPKKAPAVKKIRVKKAKAVPFRQRGIRRKSAPRLSLRKPSTLAGELVPVTRTFTTLIRDPYVLKSSEALADFYSRLGRKLYARAAFLLRTTGKLPGFDDLKNAFSAEHGLSSRQFNAISTRVAGLVQNATANLEYRRGQVTERIEQTAKTIARLEADCASLRAGQQPERRRSKRPLTVSKLKQALTHKKQRLNLLRTELAGIEREMKRPLPRVCFGGRKLAKQRHLLRENKISKTEWQRRWDQARSGQFTVLGSHNETAGCSECQASADGTGTFTLKLLVPKTLQPELGEHLTIREVDFNHGNAELAAALAHNAVTKPLYGRMERVRAQINKQSGWKNPRLMPARPAFGPGEFPSGIAASYRFTLDPRGLRIALTLTTLKAVTSGDACHGAIGIDLNAEHVSVVEVDSSGNPVWTPIAGWMPGTEPGDLATRRRTLGADLAIPTKHRQRGRIEADTWKAVIAIVARAVETRKPIVVEDLSLDQRKAALRELHGPKTARRLSSFAYAKFLECLKARAARLGVRVILIDPSYTSVQGRAVWQRRLGVSVHQAAAAVIARRGMGLVEPLPEVGFVLADGSRVAIRPAVRMAAVRSQGSRRQWLNRRAWGEVYGKVRAVLEARRRMSGKGHVPVRDTQRGIYAPGGGPKPLTGGGERSPSPQAGSTPAVSRPHAAGRTPAQAIAPTECVLGSLWVT